MTCVLCCQLQAKIVNAVADIAGQCEFSKHKNFTFVTIELRRPVTLCGIRDQCMVRTTGHTRWFSSPVMLACF